MRYSIAIPAYKKKYLKEAIDSCLFQTYSDFEIIIVNDASPENLDEIVKEYKDSRIRYYVNKVNYGAKCVTDNWNKCLNYAQGEYIICMGDDDRLCPNCLEEYNKLIEKYPYLDVFHSRVMQIDENGNNIFITSDRAEWESVYTLILHRLEGRPQYIGDSCFRISRLKSIGGYYNLPFGWSSDDLTNFTCAAPNGVANTNVPTYQYRISQFTISNSGNEDSKLFAVLKEFEWINTFITENNPKNEIDYEIVRIIKSKWNYYLGLKQEGTLTPLISTNKFNIIKCFFKRKKYSISIRTLLRTLIHS